MQLKHVMRVPLPWRDEMLTECGHDPSGRAVVSRDEFVATVKELGQQRSSMQFCMTCWNTASRWFRGDHGHELVDAVVREYGSLQWGHTSDRYDRGLAELLAIGALIAAHRDEFDGFIADMSETTSLDERRSAKRARRRMGR